MRTYSGHSTAAASNELYRTNLAKGQTGLSIAFDLPTQTGYDPDSPMAAGEVGKVGVPVAHLGHMRTLLDGIPPGQMNTSMTINATAAWLLALYVANAEEQGTPSTELRGTTQNDIVKEYLSRGTYIFPPEPSRRLIVDMVAWCAEHAPRWNPMNVCSYHLQEAGATPVQELAYALATAIGVLDAVRDSGQVAPERFGQVFGSISFFVNAGIRFVEEICKLRAFTEMWDRIGLERYGVDDPKARRFRYGVQVNSLGLTEAQPENNVQRIVLEMLGVTMSKRARARSIQLPAWNEALGLPRPWDQQWSLRMQQVLAFETDLLEYDDLFDGSHVVEAAHGRAARRGARPSSTTCWRWAARSRPSTTLKSRLVASMAERTRRIESGEQVVVGVNRFTETEPSPLGGEGAILRVDPAVEAEMIADVERWRGDRDDAAVARGARRAAAGRRRRRQRHAAVDRPGQGRRHDRRVGRRDARRVRRVPRPDRRRRRRRLVGRARRGGRAGARRCPAGRPSCSSPSRASTATPTAPSRSPSPPATPGMEVVYSGIRLTAEQIAASARDEDPDVIGLSILSGSHLELVPDLLARLREMGVDAPVVVGGIIPEEDRAALVGRRRRRRLHAEGLRPRADHGRDRRPGERRIVAR